VVRRLCGPEPLFVLLLPPTRNAHLCRCLLLPAAAWTPPAGNDPQHPRPSGGRQQWLVLS
jgi:hypothetical protein